MTRPVPWWAKLGVKVAAGALQVPHDVRVRLGFDRHGSMTDAAYAVGVAKQHLGAVAPLPARFTALELGPGDSTLSALVASALGAAETWLVDVGDVARHDPRVCDAVVELLGDDVPAALQGGCPGSRAACLARVNAHYVTDGVRSLREVPTGSIDAMWSHAVLEHIRRDELPALLGELRRVTADRGRSSHVVDLLDHLDEGFHNLRFSSRVWERPAVWRSGAYTNRLSKPELVTSFRQAGFDVEVLATRARPVPDGIRRRLADEFSERSDDELAVAGFDLLACPAGQTDGRSTT